MPKIIEHLPEKLIAEAKRQIEEGGYSAMTIRSVAASCGVGVGTVYNYFPSKEALIATHLLEDWMGCIRVIEDMSADSEKEEPVLRCIYEQVTAFAHRHSSVFRDAAAAANFAGPFSHYHPVLRSQLAQPLRKFCRDDFSADFIAEGLLTWAMSGKSFEEIFEILKKLFKE